MTQFTLHHNPDKQSKALYPYLLNVQHDLLSELISRMVIPLQKLSTLRTKPIHRLNPVIETDGIKLVLIVQQMAGISLADLGEPVADLEAYRHEIIAAIDFLITGI